MVFTEFNKFSRATSARGGPPPAKRRRTSAPALEGKAEAAAKINKPVSEVLRNCQVVLSGKDTKKLAEAVKGMGGAVMPMPGFQVSRSPFTNECRKR